MMDNLESLKIGGELVRLRDLKIRLETWRIVIWDFSRNPPTKDLP